MPDCIRATLEDCLGEFLATLAQDRRKPPDPPGCDCECCQIKRRLETQAQRGQAICGDECLLSCRCSFCHNVRMYYKLDRQKPMAHSVYLS
jgi:hypothetical protein